MNNKLLKRKIFWFTPEIIIAWLQGESLPPAPMGEDAIPKNAEFTHGIYSKDQKAFGAVFWIKDSDEME